MPKQTIRIREFVGDVRNGLADRELMFKYQLDARGLHNALQKMVEMKALSAEDLQRREAEASVEPPREERRRLPRHYVLFSFPVYDVGNLDKEAFVNDLSEQGLQISGLESQVGDVRSLLIKADEFADIYPFVFEAECQWVRERDEFGEYAAGFEIVSISDRGLQELRSLIRLLSFDEDVG